MARRLNTDCGLSDWLVAGCIAERFARMAPEHSAAKEPALLRTVILFCHFTGCPLRLIDLLNADAGSFAHDVAGIWLHLDRKTGQLTGCFDPRFAVHTEVA